MRASQKAKQNTDQALVQLVEHQEGDLEKKLLVSSHNENEKLEATHLTLKNPKRRRRRQKTSRMLLLLQQRGPLEAHRSALQQQPPAEALVVRELKVSQCRVAVEQIEATVFPMPSSRNRNSMKSCPTAQKMKIRARKREQLPGLPLRDPRREGNQLVEVPEVLLREGEAKVRGNTAALI